MNQIFPESHQEKRKNALANSSIKDSGTKKPTTPADRGVGWILATTYSRTAYRRTTIGAAAFHFRVRNGAGWCHCAMITRLPPLDGCYCQGGKGNAQGRTSGDRRTMEALRLVDGGCLEGDVKEQALGSLPPGNGGRRHAARGSLIAALGVTGKREKGSVMLSWGILSWDRVPEKEGKEGTSLSDD